MDGFAVIEDLVISYTINKSIIINVSRICAIGRNPTCLNYNITKIQCLNISQPVDAVSLIDFVYYLNPATIINTLDDIIFKFATIESLVIS